MSGDNAGLDRDESSDGRLGLGGSLTCIRPLVPSLLGRLALAGEGKVGSTGERVRQACFSLSDVVRCLE